MMIDIAFFCILAAVGWIDQRTMEVPDRLSSAVLLLAVADQLTGGGPALFSSVLGTCAVSVPMLLMTLAIPGAFGGGDIKLMAACGAFLGWRLALEAFFLAVLGGGVWGCWLLVSGKAGRKDHFAFGPFLCTGAAVSYLWGEELLSWYLSLLP